MSALTAGRRREGLFRQAHIAKTPNRCRKRNDPYRWRPRKTPRSFTLAFPRGMRHRQRPGIELAASKNEDAPHSRAMKGST